VSMESKSLHQKKVRFYVRVEFINQFILKAIQKHLKITQYILYFIKL
jgi:hypothetical protein